MSVAGFSATVVEKICLFVSVLVALSVAGFAATVVEQICFFVSVLVALSVLWESLIARTVGKPVMTLPTLYLSSSY